MQFDHLKRRELIALLGGSAVAWPFAARAQQGTIGFLGAVTAGRREITLLGGAAAE